MVGSGGASDGSSGGYEPPPKAWTLVFGTLSVLAGAAIIWMGVGLLPTTALGVLLGLAPGVWIAFRRYPQREWSQPAVRVALGLGLFELGAVIAAIVLRRV